MLYVLRDIDQPHRIEHYYSTSVPAAASYFARLLGFEGNNTTDGRAARMWLWAAGYELHELHAR